MGVQFNLFRGLALLLLAYLIQIKTVSPALIPYVFLAEVIVVALVVMRLHSEQVNAYTEIIVAISSVILMGVVFFESNDKVAWYQSYLMIKYWVGIQFVYVLLIGVKQFKTSRMLWYFPLSSIMLTGAIAVYVIINETINSGNNHIYHPMMLVAAIYLVLSGLERLSYRRFVTNDSIK